MYADSLRNTLTWQGNYMDSKFGPDGALYVQVYDGFFRANPNVGLYRFDYIGGPDTPGPDPQVTPDRRPQGRVLDRTSGGVAVPVGLRRRPQLYGGVRTHRYAAPARTTSR